jgi:hypothetical protein
MKKNYKPYLFTLLLLISGISSIKAQEDEGISAAAPIFTADSLRSGNSKDVLTSFFQLALDNLTGKNKELNFQSNPFAVMLRSNPKLNIDHYYSKYTPLRKLNFGFGIKLDTSYRFNGFSSGIKYAIIDERDHTTSKLFATRLRINGFAEERKTLNAGLRNFAIQRYSASAKTDADFKAQKDFLAIASKFFNQQIAYNSLDSEFKKIADSIINKAELTQIEKFLKDNPASSLRSNDIAVYDALRDSIKQCALWTIGISDTTYTNQFAFSNVVLSTEFSKGVFAPQAGANNIELNIKAHGNFLKDTLKAGNNLKRIIFDAEAGLNWVVRDKLNQKSWFELMLSATYYRNLTNLYQNEERSRLTVNGTARVRLFDDIWVPLEIKYDPVNGNVFGLINVKLNFTALSNMAKAAVK